MKLVNLFSTLMMALAATVSALDTHGIQALPPVVSTWEPPTRTRVGVYEDGRVEIIANDQGHRISPSYVAFTGDEILVGEAAKIQAPMNPTNTIFGAQRFAGRRFDEHDVQNDIKHVPFKVFSNDGKPIFQVNVNGEAKEFTPEQVSALVLQKLKSYLGQNVTHAIVTVPAYFNDAQRQSTRDAGTIAGLTVSRITNVPTAAAVAHGLFMEDLGKIFPERYILVYDLGGGTFDVSVLAVDEGVFEVLATNGDSHLGGEDFDNRLIEHFTEAFIKKNNGKDPRKNLEAMGKLRHEVENAKHALSSQVSVNIEIKSFCDGVDLTGALTRATFEELNIDLFKKTLGPVEKVLKDAGVGKDEIHEIILAGGSTHFFNGKKARDGINPEEAGAYGAAVQGVILSGDDGHEQYFSGDKPKLTIHVEPSDLIPIMNSLR
ncbi:glucose regulated protein 78 [Chytriomyces cf. hyalinus JEL632]|nr:glucose regulated protein 78 [Chytriomyces cf. hyalinus JEL632]